MYAARGCGRLSDQFIKVFTLSAIFDTDFAMDFTFFLRLTPAVILLFEASITTVPTAIPDIAPVTMLLTVFFCIFHISRFYIMKLHTSQTYFALKKSLSFANNLQIVLVSANFV